MTMIIDKIFYYNYNKNSYKILKNHKNHKIHKNLVNQKITTVKSAVLQLIYLILAKF